MAAAPSRDGPRAASRLAPAKLNLCLHVVGRRADGYHLLESYVAFASVGDRLDVEPARGLSLSLGGPFGAALDAGAENLVLKAALALEARLGRAAPPGAALHLEKRLPIASGVGGGSADAAAALRLLGDLWSVDSDAALRAAAPAIGADVPVCLRAPAPSWMSGVGEIVADAPAPPPFWIALVNPNQPLSTPEVFAALARRDNPPPPRPLALPTLDALTAWLVETRNDLEPAATALRPAIGRALSALRAQRGCRLARMSGSGATVFGIFASRVEAERAASVIRADEPSWWTRAAAVDPAIDCAATGVETKDWTDGD